MGHRISSPASYRLTTSAFWVATTQNLITVPNSVSSIRPIARIFRTLILDPYAAHASASLGSNLEDDINLSYERRLITASPGRRTVIGLMIKGVYKAPLPPIGIQPAI